jgi:hypothetical protein
MNHLNLHVSLKPIPAEETMQSFYIKNILLPKVNRCAPKNCASLADIFVAFAAVARYLNKLTDSGANLFLRA